MDVNAVPACDNKAGFARHARMDGCLPEAHAVDSVLRGCGDAADHVARIDILQGQCRSAFFEMLGEAFLQKVSDIAQAEIAGGVGLADYVQRELIAMQGAQTSPTATATTETA